MVTSISQLHRKLMEFVRVLEGADVVNVVEETGDTGEIHRAWIGDHYPVTFELGIPM